MDKSIFSLCESITEQEALSLDNNFYQAQMKLDGDRIIAIAKDKEVILMNRRGIVKNKQFREVVEELEPIAKEHNFIIDGEIIAENGDFNLLSSRAGTQKKHKITELEKTIPILFMVFDIISLEEVDLRKKLLTDRFLILKELATRFKDRVRLCEYKPIAEMLDKAKTENQEGIVIKRLDSQYDSRRSRNWLKLKLKQEVIIEFTKYENNNKGLRLSDEKDNAVQMARYDLINKIVNEINTKGKIACEVECLEIFDSGKMRQPVFKRIYESQSLSKDTHNIVT